MHWIKNRLGSWKRWTNSSASIGWRERGLTLEARHALRKEESKPIISIVETCRRQQIPVREYLRAVLPGLETSQQIGSTN